MPVSQNFDISGLNTYYSDTNGVPPGSLAIARNISLSQKNLAQPRRGFNILGNLPLTGDRADKLFFYTGSLLAHYGTTMSLWNGSAFVNRGSIVAPSFATSIRGATIAQNVYFTSSTGIQKMDSTANNIYPAGVPNALYSSLALSSGVNLALPTSSQVGYRYLLARKDANKNTNVGGVGSQTVISNSGSASDVTLTVYLPAGLDSSYYVQIYRTKSVGLTDKVGDEHYLVIEHPITPTEASNGVFTEVDITPDALVGAALYINSSQQGIINNNAIPPLARDVCEFQGVTFYADVEGFHRFTFTLLACGTGASQFNVGNTITFTNGVTIEVYTGAASENIGTKSFLVDIASASPSTRIANTISSLNTVINRGSAILYSTIDTNTNSLPGILTLQTKTQGAASFTTTSNNANAFNPTLSSPANPNQVSVNSAFKNGLMFSKKDTPEAVPLGNLLFVGSSDDRIKRIVALKDSLLIFKEKDGVYRLTGQNAATFSVSLMDSSAKLIAPDSIQPLNGFVYGLFEGGVAQVSDSDVSIISQPIKDKLLSLYGSSLTAVKDYTIGIGYETDGKYILALPTGPIDTYASYQLIYDVFSGVWVEWDLKMRAGAVNSVDGLLYYAASDSSRIRTERKLYDYTDFADFEQDSTLTLAVGTTLTLSGVDNMAVGDLLDQANILPAYITSVDLANSQVIVNIDQTWDVMLPISHFKGISVEIQWNRESSGNPVGLKKYMELNLPFKRYYIGDASIRFFTDVNPSVNTIVKPGPSSQGAWGYNAWDDGVWGGEQTPAPMRIGVPNQSCVCNSISITFAQSVAYSDFQLSGISYVFNPMSNRTTR